VKPTARPPRAGLLSIVDEVMAGGLIAPAGAAPAVDPAAVEWAEEAEDGDEEIPDPVWQLLGVPVPGAALVRQRRAAWASCCRACMYPGCAPAACCGSRPGGRWRASALVAARLWQGPAGWREQASVSYQDP